VFCAKKGSERPTKRTAENIEEIEQRIAETPNKSIRRLAQETNLSFGTVQLIFKKVLHLFPYCVSVVHEIKPLDNKSPHNITSLNIDL
jgi:Asp-tRNA(Asn)/Glu-tRNA(Gln) amidotransferase B subunit